MSATKRAAWSFAIVTIVLLGNPAASGRLRAGVPQKLPPPLQIVARATINSCIDGSFIGAATLFEVASEEAVKDVTVVLTAGNLTPGKHAVHIHETGACTPCSAAGSHLDLG